jgi:hypothetical protein
MKDHLSIELIVQLLYGAVAVCGGIARYLRGYVDGMPFSFGVFIASAFISGFGGWLFALIGQSMNLPQSIIFAMAGIGGFFSDQTLKLTFEYVSGKLPTK